MTVGERIRNYRKLLGLTQEQLATMTELSVMSIRRYETGERIATIETLKKIAIALEISLAELVGVNNIQSVAEIKLDPLVIEEAMKEEQMFRELAGISGYTFHEDPSVKNGFIVKKNSETIDTISENTFYRLVKRMSTTANSILEATAKSLIEDELSNQ